MKRLIVLLFILSLTGCSVMTKTVEIPVEIVKTEYIVKEVHDTTVINNFIDRWKSGDTVYIKENHSVYKYINRCDTIIKIDSFPVYVKETVTKEVSKVPAFYKAMTWIGIIFILAIVIGLILKIKK